MLGSMDRADCLKLADEAYMLGQRKANTVIADVLEKMIKKRAAS
jgi:hypothetical protein